MKKNKKRWVFNCYTGRYIFLSSKINITVYNRIRRLQQYIASTILISDWLKEIHVIISSHPFRLSPIESIKSVMDINIPSKIAFFTLYPIMNRIVWSITKLLIWVPLRGARLPPPGYFNFFFNIDNNIRCFDSSFVLYHPHILNR